MRGVLLRVDGWEGERVPKRTAVAFAAIFALWSFLAPAMAQGELKEHQIPAAYRLAQGGYKFDDEASLLAAARGPDHGLAGDAILFLGRLPPTPLVLALLREKLTASVPADFSGALFSDQHAVEAARALQALAVTGWEPLAVRRLGEMRLSLAKVLLAGILAEAGTGDGWNVIGDAFADEDLLFAPLAVSTASYFIGLKDATGEAIDVKGC